MHRPASVKWGFGIAIVTGIISLITGIILLAGGIVSAGLLIPLILFGLYYFYVAYGIWNLKKNVAVQGIGLAVLDLVLSFIDFDSIFIIDIILDIALIATIVWGWKQYS